MIVKNFELNRKKLHLNKYFLLYGNNSGLIEETIEKTLKPNLPKNIISYDENEIMNNHNFLEEICNKSFFDNEKLIIIQRATDKIKDLIIEIIEKNISEIAFILISGVLEKKSKLRNFFERNKETICVPFYEDTNQTLSIITQNFLKEKKIALSQQNINMIVNRSRGDRINLYNELNKIDNFTKNKKKIETEDILKLTNLSENFDFSELIDSALAKNQKKTSYILSENNFSQDDTILIVKIFLNKLKRLLKIKSQIRNNNVEAIISNFKPPIFWKEKDILKQQIKVWDYKKIQDLLVKTYNIEMLAKKNPAISINIITDFILEQAA